MGRNRHRGRRRRRPGHFTQPDNDNNIAMQDTWDDRDAGRGRTRNRKGQWQGNRRPELSPREVEELYADLEDDLIDDQPAVMYDPLEQIIKHHQQQNTRRQRNNNSTNVHSPLFQQPSNFNHTPFQQRRQQLLHQPQQKKQVLQRHVQRKDQHDCHDCRTARKANVRLRNALHSHIKAATATLAEWSTEVGVPFGGVADDEMDWQPEPEIRVVFVPQHQQYQQQGDSRRYYNDHYHHHRHYNKGGGLSAFEYSSAPGTRYVGYGGYGGYGAHAGHAGGSQGMSPSSNSITDGSIPTAPWWLESEIASLEESTEETAPPNESPEELYHHQQQLMALEPDPFKAPAAATAPPTRSYGSMVLEPDPFKAPMRGSGFAANAGGASPLGMLANQSTANSSASSSSGVVEIHSATPPPCGTLAGMNSAPSTEVDEWEQREKTSPEVLRKYRARY
ncbi:hypothetical protein PG985_000633 [Apiospora marii]|uniref:Uncharacterized protein n=1 Tax=Apiospora marii TaxID=335849 RepID=A0ABR1R2J8_9PEZI